MKLSSVRSETADIDVHFASGDLHVTYRPNNLTADAVDRVNDAASDSKKQTDSLFMQVSEIITRWDLEDDEGQIIDLKDTAKLRAEVPMAVFGKIFLAMQEAQNPGKAPQRS